MEMENLRDLFVEQLKDIYSAENQIIKALPKMAKAASNPQLRQAFEEHLEQTRGQVQRLEQIFESLGERAKGKTCQGMKGLIEENKEALEEDAEPEVLDAGMIVGAQKVEHYEIAAYGSVVTFAKLLGDTQAAKLLAQTLDEEEKTDKKLSDLAKSVINAEAMSAKGN